MTKAQRQTRRQRNQELGRMDAANRCPVCKKALGKGPFVVLAAEQVNQRRFCSDACADEAVGR